MKTAEELKKQAHKLGFMNGLYIFTEFELESYVEQVAKEQCGKCAFNPAPKGYHDIEEFYPNED